MLKTKIGRHTVAFVTIILASILLYLFAQAGMFMAASFLLALIVLAAILTLTTK